MKKILRLLFIKILSTAALLLIFAGCNLFNGGKNSPKEVNSYGLTKLVLNALSGDSISNEILSGLIDLKIPVNKSFNNIQIDSIRTNSGKRFYAVLIEYPNPLYNRFAVYDLILKSYIIDKSLNGNLSISIDSLTGYKTLTITENFISKDILSLQRVSLYIVNDTSVNLAFRSFSKLTTPDNIFTQTISGISDGRIKTDLNSSKPSAIQNKADVFLFDYNQKKFISTNNVFDNFVKQQVNNLKHEVEKPEIIDMKSAMLSVGIDLSVDTIKSTANTKDTEGFALTLTDNWHAIRNFSMDDLFTQKIIGTRFINQEIGASISVVKIPPADSAEMYVDYKLINSSAGKYKVRYSDKILMRKDFIQCFEFTCQAKKYLLIMQASKYTYDQYKNIFSTIIDSFTIDC